MVTIHQDLSAGDFILLGLDFAGFHRHSRQNKNVVCTTATNIRRFRAYFGISPESCCKMFMDLQTAPTTMIKKHNPAYFMMTLQWLSTYAVEETLAGSYKLDEKTVRKWIWDYTKSIQALKEKKVSALGGYVVVNVSTCVSSQLYLVALALANWL